MPNESPIKPIVSSSRQSINVALQVLTGKIPMDMYGYAYMNTPSGTVNSPLPYPKNHADGSINQEYGSSSLGGDAYVMRFDFSKAGTIQLKTNILQTFPAYQADEATKYGKEGHEILGFRNFGIARISPLLGARDQAATAFVPVLYAGETNYRLYATSDLGRAYEFDPASLRCLAPVGKIKDFVPATPSYVPWVFPLIQGTAHPVFDTDSKVFYTLNYTKSMSDLLSSVKFLQKITSLTKLKDFEKELETKIIQLKDTKLSRKEQAQEVIKFFNDNDELTPNDLNSSAKSSGMIDAVYILAYNGKGNFQKWNITDQHGKNIEIIQCVHQMGITKDYVLFSDSAFKITLDILSPFAYNAIIDDFIRYLTSVPQEAFTNLYIVKKTDLQTGASNVKAMTFKLSPEFVHFTCDYINDNQIITLYSANNSAACLAEWIRFYDTLIDDTKADPSSAGILATGAMDVSRMGKAVINLNTMTVSSDYLHLTGNEPGGKGAHTWIAGFYTYNGMLSPYKQVEKIKDLYWQCSGLENRRLSKFIYSLYENYPNRIVPLNEVVAYTEKGVPFQVSRLNTETMKIEDFYSLPKSCEIMSLQFIPRKRPESTAPMIHNSRDGYILCAVINEINPTYFRREMWLFDAGNLQAGVVCVLSHPNLDFSTTLHWVWMETAPVQKGSITAHKSEIIDLAKNIESDVKTTVNQFVKKFLHKKAKK